MKNTNDQHLKEWNDNNRRLKDNHRNRLFFEQLGGTRAFGYTLANFPRKHLPVFQAALSFTPATDNYYFWGSSWVGKTHLATALGHHFFDLGYDVFITSMKNFKETLLGHKEKFSSMERKKYIDKLINARVLIFHELGRDPLTDYIKEELFHVFDTRLLADRDGFIGTGNFPFSELGKWAGGALFERLKDLIGVRGIFEFPKRNLEDL